MKKQNLFIRALGFLFRTVSFIFGMVILVIAGVIAIVITPFKIANSMANSMTKQLWDK